MTERLSSLDELESRLDAIIAFAHKPEHWIDTDKGESVETAAMPVIDKETGKPVVDDDGQVVVAYRLTDFLSFMVSQPGADTGIQVDYAVVRQKGIWWRRLVVGFTVQGQVTQGQLNRLMEHGQGTPWHMLLSGLATRVFPNRARIRTAQKALPARPVVDPNDHDKLLHFRTPVSIAMYVEWDQVPDNLHVVKHGRIIN